ncbi:MAG: HAMP domain-containing histidine kinase, partial [Clostridia bacterium]|nr:HAMP domain-containing histidine kinase [Clostridia bacterium]
MRLGNKTEKKSTQKNDKKKRRAGDSLFIKFFALASAVVVLAIFVGGSLQVNAVVRQTQNNTVSTLQQGVETVSTVLKYTLNGRKVDELSFTEKHDLSRMLYHLSDSLKANLFVCDADGNVILGLSQYDGVKDSAIDRSDYEHFDTAPLYDVIVTNVKLGGGITDQTDVYSSGVEDVDCCFATSVRSEAGMVMALVTVVAPTGTLGAHFYETMKIFVASAFFALGIVFIGIYAITYKLLKPISNMSKAVYRFAQGDYSYRVKVTTDDEFGELGNAFNSMAAEISNSEHSRRSFVANVSHEFKTPMTTIGGFVNGIIDGTIPEEKSKEYLELVSDEVKRLSKLITILLNLSRIESGDLQLKKRPYDFSQQLFAIALSFEQLVEKKGIEILGLDTIEKTTIVADYDLLYQVVYNLVDNAVKFTNNDGYIKFSVNVRNERIYFSLQNSGAGIPPDDLPMVFDRFYKVDKSRGMNAKSTGLGLFLVRSIVE